MQLRGPRFQPTSDAPHLTLKKTAAYAALILLGLGFYELFNLNYVRSPFAPPPTPTRSAASFTDEGKAFYDAGQLDKSIAAYQKAVAVDPKNTQLLAELARIQTYSSALILSSTSQQARMKEAQDSVNK
jgi:tetratricopeptide (TPR) repeat protein